MSKGYTYLGQHYDVLGREISINDKKYGKTITPDIREKSLSRTKSPIRYMNTQIWEFEDEKTAIIVESLVHLALDSRRTDGEWFQDDNEDLIEIVESIHSKLNALGITITPYNLLSKIQNETGTTESQKAELIETVKKSRLVLRIFIDGDEISAPTAIDRYIQFANYVSNNFPKETLLEKLPSYFKTNEAELPSSLNSETRQNRNYYTKLENNLYFVSWGSNQQKITVIENIKRTLKISNITYKLEPKK